MWVLSEPLLLAAAKRLMLAKEVVLGLFCVCRVKSQQVLQFGQTVLSRCARTSGHLQHQVFWPFGSFKVQFLVERDVRVLFKRLSNRVNPEQLDI